MHTFQEPYDQNKACEKLTRTPFSKADFKTFSILEQIEANIFEVNSSIFPTFFAYSPFLIYKILRLTSFLPFPFIYVKDRNNVNVMIYQKPLSVNYFEKVLKYSTSSKFGHLRMHFILIKNGTCS